jgi:hypothetical protein
MDTQTVIDIVKMIDAQVKNLTERNTTLMDDRIEAQIEVLTSLSNHLDGCLDAQLNGLENETEQ